MSSTGKEKVKEEKKIGNFLYDFVKITGFIPVLCWMRPRIVYQTKRPKIKGGFLIAANHVSFTDPIIVHCAFWRRRLHCIATKDLYASDLRKFFFDRMHCIMVDKENFNMRTFHTVCERLQENKVVVVFPEGGVNHNANELMSFKSGAILMAYKARKPIVPVYINPISKWSDRRVAVIGDPIEINPTGALLPSMEEVKQINAKLQERELELKALYEQRVKRKAKRRNNDERI